MGTFIYIKVIRTGSILLGQVHKWDPSTEISITCHLLMLRLKCTSITKVATNNSLTLTSNKKANASEGKSMSSTTDKPKPAMYI